MERPFNPFSTSRIRPDAVGYRFPPGIEVRQLVHRLEEQHWRGEIVGPHGSGKTTLLQTLIPELTALGRDVRLYTLRDQQRQLPCSWPELRNWTSRTLVIVDGYEQLSRVSRWILTIACRLQGAGLLVTCHESTGFPTLLQTTSDLAMLRALVKDLLAEFPIACHPTDAQMETAFRTHHGNIRESLLALYDIYQQRQVGHGPVTQEKPFREGEAAS